MKFLREMWEGIDYKGFTIEYNQDALDRAIAQGKEIGELHFTFNYFVTKDGKHITNTSFKTVERAKKYIDTIAKPRYIAYWDDLLPWKQYMSKYWLDPEAHWNELEGTRNQEDVYYDSFIVSDKREAYAFESKEEAIDLLNEYGNDIFADDSENEWIAHIKFEEIYK